MNLGVIALLLLSAPDPSPRTPSWRVVDTGVGCEAACTSPVDAARDTSCIQDAIDFAALGYRGVELPFGDCHIETRLDVMNVTGFEVHGHGIGRTRLVWDGNDTDPVLYIADVNTSGFYDFSIVPGTNKTIDTAIEVDNCNGCYLSSQPGSYGYNPGKNRLYNIDIGAPSAGHTLRSGIVFGVTDANNNEFHSIRDVSVSRHHVDAARLEGSQQKSLLFENFTCLSDPAFLEVSTCVRSEGSFSFIGGGGGSNDTDFYINGQGGPIEIINANFETSLQFLRHGANNGNRGDILVQGVRWESDGVGTSTVNVIETGYSGGITLLANHFGTYSALKPLAMRFVGLSYAPNVMIGNSFFTSLTAADRYPVNIPFVHQATQGTRVWAVTANVSTNEFSGANHELVANGAVVFFGTLPSGMSAGTTYYAKTIVSASAFTISTSPGGATFDVTSAGSGIVAGNYGALLDDRIRVASSSSAVNVFPGYVEANGALDINNGVTSITELIYGYEGQVVTLWAHGSAGRTVVDNDVDIDLSGDANFTLSGNATLTLRRLGGLWVEVSRSAN